MSFKKLWKQVVKSLPISLKLTFKQWQLLELNILRVAIAGRALRLLGLLLEGSLGEGVYPVHEGPWRHLGINGGTVGLSWWCSSSECWRLVTSLWYPFLHGQQGSLATRDRDHRLPEVAAFRRPQRTTLWIHKGKKERHTLLRGCTYAVLHPITSIPLSPPPVY